MICVIFTAISIFVATGIDEMVVLTIIFVHASKTKAIKDIFIGEQIGMIIILCISMLAVFGISIIDSDLVGLLGLIPIIQGLRILLYVDKDNEEDEITNKLNKFNSLILTTTFIVVAGGGEEISIYIPYFASLEIKEMIITLITFNIMVPIWCMVCKSISNVKPIKHIVEKFERILVPIVFIGLGVFVLIENNTLISMLKLLK